MTRTTQNTTIFKGLSLGLTVCLFFFAQAQFAQAAPRLTLIPPQNQRSDLSETYGVFVEFYLRCNLAKTGLLEVTSFEVTRQLQGAPPYQDKGYQLSGQFQKVAKLVYLHLSLQKPDGQVATWEQTFAVRDTLGSLENLGAWVLQEMGLSAPWPPWWLSPEDGKLLYQLRLRRYQSDQAASLDQARQLSSQYGGSTNETVVGVVALQLMLTAQSDLKKGASLFKRADRILRKSLLKHPHSGELLALLALDYHLSGGYPQFVEKTSVDALALQPSNELAWFLAAWSTGLSSGLGKERLQRFATLHPLAWNRKLKYLSGMLDTELSKASTVLTQLHHPDPYQLRSQ